MPVDATLQPWEPLPFVEAADFWRSRVPLTPERVESLSGEARARAFTVAGLAKQRMVESVFTGLQQAIEAGESYGEFKKRIRDVIAEKGWTGKRDFRVQTIFRTNIQTAYNTGKWQQIQEAGDALEYLQYDAVGDSRTRPTHAALDGKVFHKDSAFWKEWYPPNGFNCRCTVRAMSKAEMEARGLRVEDAGDYLGMPVTVGPGRDQVLLPDPGFGTNAARNFWEGLAAAGAGPGSSEWNDLPGLRGPADFGRPPLKDIPVETLPVRQRDKELPRTATKEEVRAAVADAFGPSGITDPLAGRVVPSTRFDVHMRMHRANHAEIIPLIPDVVSDPLEIWDVPMTNGKEVRIRRCYVQLWRPEGKRGDGLLVVAEVEGINLTGITAFAADRDDYLEDRRRGWLRYVNGEGATAQAHCAATRHRLKPVYSAVGVAPPREEFYQNGVVQ